MNVPDRRRESGPISLFVPGFHGGGGERITLLLAQEFMDLGRTVDLVVGSDSGPLRAEVPPDVNLVDLGCAHLRNSLPALVRYLRHVRPAVLMPTIGHANVVSVVAAGIARSHTAVAVRVSNTFTQQRRTPLTPFGRLTLLLAPRAYRHADLVVACSLGMADDLAAATGIPRDRISVVPNPVVGPRLPTLAAAALDHPWFQPGQPPVVLGVGSLIPQKNFARLVRAFAELRADRDARLLILGEGPERADLERLASQLGVTDDVQLPGFDANPYRHMACCAAFVLSSDWEGLPGVLIEALACGAPVVATDCPSGPREILDGGRYGRLIPMGDDVALVAALRETLDQPRPAPQEAWEPFTTRNSALHYLELLDELTAGPGSTVRAER